MKRNQGFTLMEILISIAIIGVLVATIAPSLNSARGKAIDTRRVSELDGVAKALEQYYLENASFPDDGVSDEEVTLRTIESALVPEFTAALPVDIVFGDTTDGYMYCVTDDRSSYHLRTPLEDDDTASTTSHCGVQRGPDAASACPNAATDDVCIDRF